MTEHQSFKFISIFSNHSFGGYSSYPVLTKHIKSNILYIERKEPKTLIARFLNKLLRFFSLTQWYKLTSFFLELRLLKSLLSNEVDLIHFLWAERDLGYSDFILRFTSIPVCATFHCCPEDLQEIIKYPHRLKFLSKIIIMSEIQRPFFESCGIESKKIQCVLHGIDTVFFEPSGSLNAKKEKFTVLSVGNYKRNFKLLKEIAQKLSVYSGIDLHIVTSTERFSYFEELKNVKLLTGLTDSELKSTYQNASCLLMTVENATANNALLEGMASGLPIVAENIGGIPEYVDSNCSVLCPPNDTESLVKTIVNLYEQPLKVERMGEASRARALELSWNNIADKTNYIYSQLLEESDDENSNFS